MGLDISFNRTKAVEAGLVLIKERRGSEQEIAAIRAGDDASYYRYLMEEVDFIKVPTLGSWVENSGVGNTIVIRANKWGYVYYPMTEWLTQHGITWGEF